MELSHMFIDEIAIFLHLQLIEKISCDGLISMKL